MSTTLQNLITNLKGSGLLPSSQIFAGLTDGLAPPFLSVLDFTATVDYDTGGIAQRDAGQPAYALKDSIFRVLIVHTSCDLAESLAASVDEYINCNTDLTPNCIGCLQADYKSSQGDEKLYLWTVEITYNLKEQFS